MATASPEVFRDHVDHILGKSVCSLTFKIAGEDYTPPWPLVLSYEHEIRKAAVEKVSYEKLDIAAALLSVYRDMEHRQQHFLTPAMGSLVVRAAECHQKAPAPPPPFASFARPDTKRQKTSSGSSKPGGKGGKGQLGKSGKASGKGSKGSLHDKTKEGKDICFRWNRDPGLCVGKCDREHCCRICFGRHPMCEHGSQ